MRGRRVVVTGASQGLGRLISMSFAQAGARLLLVGRRREALDEWASVLRQSTEHVETCAADVSVPEDNERVVQAAVSAWGGLDVWIANAGVSNHFGGTTETPVATWRAILDTNLDGVLYGCQSAARLMRENGDGGSIIVTSSVLGTRPKAGLAAYSASKAGAEALVKTLALELGPDRITVNAVAPGWFDSPLAEAWMRRPDLERQILDHTALGRWGASEDLPGIYLFLASRASRFVTGAVIPVDGGYLCV